MLTQAEKQDILSVVDTVAPSLPIFSQYVALSYTMHDIPSLLEAYEQASGDPAIGPGWIPLLRKRFTTALNEFACPFGCGLRAGHTPSSRCTGVELEGARA